MLEIHNLQKVQDGKTILDITSFEVLDGHIVGLVSRTGSGSDVLVSLITGRTQPSAGTIHLSGFTPYTNHSTLSQVLGVMFAEDTQYKNLGVLANLIFQARLRGLSKGRAESVLAQVGLADQARLTTGKLSPSLLRRLAFGCAILHEPKFLLLLEPFARCDEATVSLLISQIQQLVTGGTAVLILSGDSASLMTLCDHVYELQEGHISTVEVDSGPGFIQQPFKIPIKTEDKVLLLNPADILYADASGDRAFIVTTDERLPTQYTLTELEKRLARSGFFRAHRSYLVNLQHVKEVIPFTRNSFSLRLDDPTGMQIPLSKSAASELRDLLGF
jgi:ABC-2 type transport system ATP-binding protein